MLGTWASSAAAIACSRRFFSAVKSWAMRGAAARASSSFSRVVAVVGTVMAISITNFPSGEIGSDFSRQRPFDRVGMASIDDRNADSSLAGAAGGAQFRTHASGTELAFAITELLHGGSQFAHSAEELRRFTTVRDVKAVDVGE